MSHLHSEPRRYPYPIPSLVLPALRVLLGVPSSPSDAAALLLDRVRPVPRVLHAENIPPDSPFILVLNHYDHPALGAWWGASLILQAVRRQRTKAPRELRLVMTREWWYPGGIGRALKQPLTRWFFGQMARTYGFVRLPPVIGKTEFRGQGAIEVRHALALTRGSAPQLIGIAPEGRTGENLSLCEPPPGAGLFLLMLTHGTLPCLPVGIYEDDASALTASFGAPFQLNSPCTRSRDERDRGAARQVMVEIGKLLPERMWGVYSAEIRKCGNRNGGNP